MKRSLCGRVDLIYALACEDPSLTASMADTLGYDETAAIRPQLFRGSAVSTGSEEAVIDEREIVPYEPAEVPFWQLTHYEAIESGEPRRESRSPSRPSWRRPTKVPAFKPLAPKAVVLTRLRQVSAMRRATHEIDVAAVVERLSRSGSLHDIPRRFRHGWGSEIYVIEDRARRLVPYWLDQEYVTSVLRYVYPSSGLTVARITDDESEPVIQWPQERRGRYVPPLPGARVLVLGDLGCLATGGEPLQCFWLNWGLSLRDRQVPAVALVSTPVKAIPKALPRVWTVVRWDAAGGAMHAPGLAQAALARLLTLVSPTVRLEPGLLRAVRCLLPEGRRDAGLEARVWQNRAIASQHSVAATWVPERCRAYMLRFASEPEHVRQLLLERVRAWRAGVHESVWFEELIGLDPQSQHTLVDAADVEDSKAFFIAFTQALESGPPSPDTAAWILRLAERLPATANRDQEILRAVQRMYNLVRPHDDENEIPAWYDPAAVSIADQPVRHLTLWQVAGACSCNRRRHPLRRAARLWAPCRPPVARS